MHAMIRSWILCTALGVSVVQAQIDEVSDAERLAALEREAHIERMVMVPMRDGVHLASRVYLPKDAKGPIPTILWRSPYNLSDDVPSRPGYGNANWKFALDAIRRGYAFVMQNERGRVFYEGEWEILGRPRTDGYDALDWIAAQSWSDGGVGAIGCSSTAEWQMGLASTGHPALKALVPMAAGAGIGRIGPYYEQGNLYRGGALQLPMLTWLYGEQNTVQPRFAADLSREERLQAERYFDLAANLPYVDWKKASRHLPVSDLIRAAGGPPGIADTLIQRLPDDPAWYQGGLYHDNEPFHVPALWINSWFDLGVAPNIALYEHLRRNASTPFAREHQYMIVAPTEHCHQYRLRDPHVVGERDMGTVDFELDRRIWDFFDFFLKKERNGFIRQQSKVMYFAMGSNEWKKSTQWPPKDLKPMTLYLTNTIAANSVFGDGALVIDAPLQPGSDQFVYDPMNPVPSLGGNVCCLGDAVLPGSYDQRGIEARQDVLVYTTAPLEEDLEITGFIEATLYVASDAPDTDFTIKLLEVLPDGTAYNLDETIKRARFREGYDQEVFMAAGEVYPLRFEPMVTSNVVRRGHRIRIEVSSSNFPRFERNLNTGGRNAFETEGVPARNTVHHGATRASYIVVPARKAVIEP
jgi:putative CocE/NonD family hydrolase